MCVFICYKSVLYFNIFRVLSEARDQVEFPDLTGTHHLEMLSVDRGSIKSIPEDLCQQVYKLKVL